MQKKLIVTGLAAVVLLLAASAIVFYGLKSGGFLERRIAALVEEKPGDKFSFNGLTPNLDLSLTVNEPKFSREGLNVSAQKVTIRLSYLKTILGEPAAEWFKIETAQVQKAGHRLSNIQVQGSCPKMKGGLILDGWLRASLTTDSLGQEEYAYTSSFKLANEKLDLEGIELRDAHDGLAKGHLTYSQSSAGKSFAGVLDFANKGPRFGKDSRVFARPRGLFKFDSSIKDPSVSLFAKGSNLPLPALLPFLPAKSQETLATLSSTSQLDVSASLNGPFSNLQGTVTVTPQNLSLEVAVLDQTVPINLVHGGLELKIFSTPQKLTIHTSIEPPAALEVAGSICALSGVVKDVLKKRELSLSLSASQIELSKLIALAPEKIAKRIAEFSPTGHLTLTGRVGGEALNPLPDIVCIPTGLGLQIPLKDGVLPIKLVKGRLHLQGVDLHVDDMLLETLSTPITFTGLISDLKAGQKLDLTAKIEKANIKTLLDGLPPSLKPDLGKTKGSLGGSLKKGVLSIGGTFREPHVYGWLDLTGLSAKHSAFKNRSFLMQRGRVSLQSSGDGEWKDLRLTLGKVVLTTAGKFASLKTVEGDLKVFLPLPEVPQLLGLQQSLKMTGNTSLDGKLSGEPASIVATGTLIAAGNQTIAFLGAKRPFYVDSADIRSAWRFDGKSGELSLPAISASFLGGQLAAKAKVSILSQNPQHWLKLLLKGVDMNRLATRGANLPNLLAGKFTCTAENNVAGKKGIESMKGEGVVTITDMVINGGTLVDISGWDKYFPSPQKKHRSIGRALLHGLAEVLIERSGNKALQGYAAIREVLRREHRFGTLTAIVKTQNGVITVDPISTTGANSTLKGKFTIHVKDLVIDGLFTSALIYDNKYLAVNDIAVKGSASAPQFKLTKPVLDTFVMKRLK